MPDYLEYDPIKNSIDATRREIEKTDDLTEAIKKGSAKKCYIFPISAMRNPMEPIFIELQSGNNMVMLECIVSEN
jgi:hypothetical protein